MADLPPYACSGHTGTCSCAKCVMARIQETRYVPDPSRTYKPDYVHPLDRDKTKVELVDSPPEPIVTSCMHKDTLFIGTSHGVYRLTEEGHFERLKFKKE